jgi:peptide/nickel transport system permease protein
LFRAFFKRLIIAIPVLWVISILSFFMIHMVPGDPVDMMISPDMPKEMFEKTRESLGLDKPIYIMYINWLKELLKGNLGYSFRTFEPVTRIIGQRIGPTVTLMGTALTFSILLALGIGTWSALNKGQLSEHLITVVVFLGNSIPNFFLGLVLIYFFTLQLRIFPSSGMVTVNSGGGFWDKAVHMVLPVIVLTSNMIGQYIRYIRSSMLEVFKEDYIRTARAKGLPKLVVVIKHALRNALIPFITVIGNNIPYIFGGALITEQVFSWPGVGQLMMASILNRDYPVLMALLLMTAVITVITNLLVDIIYAVIDPRIRYS